MLVSAIHQTNGSAAHTGAQGVQVRGAYFCWKSMRVSAPATCIHRVPLVLGRNHDFGADGKLLVCDAAGTYLVDIRYWFEMR